MTPADEPSPDEGESQPIELPVPITEAEREQLAQTNEERHDWLARDGAPDRTIMPGGYRRAPTSRPAPPIPMRR